MRRPAVDHHEISANLRRCFEPAAPDSLPADLADLLSRLNDAEDGSLPAQDAECEHAAQAECTRSSGLRRVFTAFRAIRRNS